MLETDNTQGIEEIAAFLFDLASQHIPGLTIILCAGGQVAFFDQMCDNSNINRIDEEFFLLKEEEIIRRL